MANKASRDTACRVTAARRHRAEAGQHSAREPRPLGFERGGVTINPAEAAEIVRRQMPCSPAHLRGRRHRPAQDPRPDQLLTKSSPPDTGRGRYRAPVPTAGPTRASRVLARPALPGPSLAGQQVPERSRVTRRSRWNTPMTPSCTPTTTLTWCITYGMAASGSTWRPPIPTSTITRPWNTITSPTSRPRPSTCGKPTPMTTPTLLPANSRTSGAVGPASRQVLTANLITWKCGEGGRRCMQSSAMNW